MNCRSLVLICILALVSLVVACEQEDRTLVPNRVLDRPMDMTLACIDRTSGDFAPLSLNQCAADSAPNCDSGNQLLGFVANSERNEIAVFRRCSELSLVDLDASTPGYQFLPAGELPQGMATTTDGCNAVSANLQSCDLSVVDVPATAALAFDEEPVVAGGSIVDRLRPRTVGGQPLAVSPGALVPVPRFGGDASDADTGVAKQTDGGTNTDATDTGGGSQADVCPVASTRSLYVTFPSCQLVAEVSLVTGELLQSLQFTKQPDGTVTVVDSGVDPDCPVDCPAQFEGDIPAGTLVDGIHPTALELALRPRPSEETELDPAQEEYARRGYDALFVGGPESPFVFEVPLSDDGQFAPAGEVNRLELEDPGGIHGIDATPAMELADFTGARDPAYQFLYVVAGDGSTHVVERSMFETTELGVECDTQVDPTVVAPAPCHEIEPGLPDTGLRRPLAAGPGIRAPGGATINDWTFIRVPPDAEVDADDDESIAAGRGPLDQAGVIGIGVTSVGEIAVTVFGQFSGPASAFLEPIGPPDLLSAQIQPHMLWPVVPGQDPDARYPLVEDEPPVRTVPREAQATAVLSPTLRRIDLAYTNEVEADTTDENPLSATQQRIAVALGNPGNQDGLGTFGSDEELGPPFYESPVVRTLVRDYRRWTPQEWTLAWEAPIPGASSSTGRFQCDMPGWPEGADPDGPGGDPPLQGGTCLVPPADYVRPKDGGGRCSMDDPSCPEGFACDIELTRCVRQCEMDADCVLTNDAGEPVDASGEPADDPSEYVPDPDQYCSSDPGFPGCRLRDETRSKTSRLLDEGATFCDEGVLAGDKLVVLGCDEDDDCGTGQRCLREPASPRSSGICVSEAQYDSRRDELRQICEPFITDPCGPARREYIITRATQEELWLQAMDLRRTSYLRPSDDEPSVSIPDPADPGSDFEFVPTEEHIERLSCVLPEGRGGEQLEQPEGGCESDEECQSLTGDEAYVCIDSRCRAPCEHVSQLVGSDVCRLSPLPGPGCFQEFTRYQIRLRNSFMVVGNPVARFFDDRVEADPETGECREDPNASTLLTSRLWVGANERETFNHPVQGIPACVSSVPTPFDPNPCRIVQARQSNPESAFHTFAYHGNEVAAIRFSNPFMSIVIDLTNLLGLAIEVPTGEGFWRPDAYCPEGGQSCAPEQSRSFSQFYRARIPDGYRQRFQTGSGYQPLSLPPSGTSRSFQPLTYPVRVVRAPELGWIYVVDAGGRGGLTGLRGQVQRVSVSSIPLVDPNFEVQ